MITIFYQGKPLVCREGLSVGAALWENGVRILSHSHKYGRPRGMYCARGHCMSCLMRVDGVPNVRVCRTTIREGMSVSRQDAGAFYAPVMHKVMDLGGDFLPVGFYFKWFTRPEPLRRVFLDSLRPMAGVGRLPDAHTWTNDQPPLQSRDLGLRDTIVIGAGPAGLSAALQADGEVLLLDDQPIIGGHRRAALARVAECGEPVLDALPRLQDLHDRLESLCDRIDKTDHIEARVETRIVGAYQPDSLLIRDEAGAAIVRGRRIIWAGGAWDRGGAFENNDLPGILGPRALYRLVAGQGLRLGDIRAVVVGSGLDLWLSAALLHSEGVHITLALVGESDSPSIAAAHDLGWTLHTGFTPTRAASRKGVLASLEASDDGGVTRLPTDLAIICTRAKPAYDVPYQLGAKLVLDPARGGFAPRDKTDPAAIISVVGEARGLSPEEAIS